MIKKIILYFWSLRHQFVKYFAIGLSAVFLDIASLFVLKEYAGLKPVAAVVINQIFIFNYVFFLNKHWAFKSRGMAKNQMARFFINSLWNYLFAIVWMWILYDKMRVNYLLARIANIALAVSWNFLLYKYWIYAERPEITSS